MAKTNARNRIGQSKSDRVAQTLEEEILVGRIATGDQLDSEQALMKRFSVSRNTVRKGLEHLARQGLITTRSGIGSFVTYAGETLDADKGWTLALSKSDDEIHTRVLEIYRGPCEETSRFLGLRNIEYLCVDRLRTVASTGLTISLERSRLCWRDSFQGVLDEGLPNDSVSQVLTGAGMISDHGEEWAEVLPSLSESDAKIMARCAGEPMLFLRRTVRSETDEIIEYVESILDPTRFGLRLSF